MQLMSRGLIFAWLKILLKIAACAPECGRVHRVTFSGVVGVCTENDSIDRIFIRLGVFESLEYHGSYCIASAVAISGLIKGLAVSSCREEVTPIQASKIVRIGNNIGPARDGSVAIASP